MIERKPTNLTEKDVFKNEEVSKRKPQKEINFGKLNAAIAYKLIIDTRKFEIENFWKRTYFFWGLLTLVVGGYFSLTSLIYNKSFFLEEEGRFMLLFVSYLGLFFSIIFSLSTRGSKFWQEHWEDMAERAEDKNEIKADIFKHKPKEITILNKEHFLILKPYRWSVSKLTFLIGDIIVLYWLIITIRDFSVIVKKKYFQFNCSEIHFNSLLSVIIPLVFGLYIYVIYK